MLKQRPLQKPTSDLSHLMVVQASFFAIHVIQIRVNECAHNFMLRSYPYCHHKRRCSGNSL